MLLSASSVAKAAIAAHAPAGLVVPLGPGKGKGAANGHGKSAAHKPTFTTFAQITDTATP